MTQTVLDRVVVRFCLSIAGVVLLALSVATVAYELRLLQTTTRGEQYPMPIYPPLPTPGTYREEGARGAAGADFSQVYTSASALRAGESAYKAAGKEFADRFGRPPGYPPLMNYVALPLSLLEYGDAFLLYSMSAWLALVGSAALLLWKTGLKAHIGRVILAQSSLYFLTPIGLTHLERGQFDALVATAATLCVGCVFVTSNAWLLALIAGLLGALKWTAVAFLGCFAALGFLLSSGGKRWSFFLVPVMMLAGTLPFWTQLLEYWTTIQVYEIDAKPGGLTMQHYLPRAVARAMPVVATLSVAALSFIRFRTAADRTLVFRQVSAPFAVMLMNLAICFGTLSYEYHTVATLSMIPVLVMWTRRAFGLPIWLKNGVCMLFIAFAAVAFRTYGFTTFTSWTMTKVYMGFALLFYLVCVSIVSLVKTGESATLHVRPVKRTRLALAGGRHGASVRQS